MIYFFDQNIVIFPSKKDNMFLFYHPFSRSNFISKVNFLQFYKFNKKKMTKAYILKYFKKEKIYAYNTTKFKLWSNMYNNSNMVDEKLNLTKPLSNSKLFDYLEKNFFLLKNKKKYNLNKISILDRYRGNINEQIGTESIIRSKNIENWWNDQKFDKYDNLKKTPYYFIQKKFLYTFFKKYLKNKKVLEIGSGNGFWTFEMSKYASEILAIDYEKKYILSSIFKKKKKNIENIKYLNEDINNFKTKKKFDYIFFIDVFLFFFDKKFQKKLNKNNVKIIKKISNFLKKDGKILIMDPSLFWLTPFFGGKQNPFGIVTEYKSKHLSTIPSLSEYSDLFFECKLKIDRIFEPIMDKKDKNFSLRTYNFYNMFPQWHVFLLSK